MLGSSSNQQQSADNVFKQSLTQSKKFAADNQSRNPSISKKSRKSNGLDLSAYDGSKDESVGSVFSMMTGKMQSALGYTTKSNATSRHDRKKKSNKASKALLMGLASSKDIQVDAIEVGSLMRAVQVKKKKMKNGALH